MAAPTTQVRRLRLLVHTDVFPRQLRMMNFSGADPLRRLDLPFAVSLLPRRHLSYFDRTLPHLLLVPPEPPCLGENWSRDAATDCDWSRVLFLHVPLPNLRASVPRTAPSTILYDNHTVPSSPRFPHSIYN